MVVLEGLLLRGVSERGQMIYIISCVTGHESRRGQYDSRTTIHVETTVTEGLNELGVADVATVEVGRPFAFVGHVDCADTVEVLERYVIVSQDCGSVAIAPVNEVGNVGECKRLRGRADVCIGEFNSTFEVEVERTEELHIEFRVAVRLNHLLFALCANRSYITYASGEGLKLVEFLVTCIVQENLRGRVVEQLDGTYLIVGDLSDLLAISIEFATRIVDGELVHLTIGSGNNVFLRHNEAPAGVYRIQDSLRVARERSNLHSTVQVALVDRVHELLEAVELRVVGFDVEVHTQFLLIRADVVLEPVVADALTGEGSNRSSLFSCRIVVQLHKEANAGIALLLHLDVSSHRFTGLEAGNLRLLDVVPNEVLAIGAKFHLTEHLVGRCCSSNLVVEGELRQIACIVLHEFPLISFERSLVLDDLSEIFYLSRVCVSRIFVVAAGELEFVLVGEVRDNSVLLRDVYREEAERSDIFRTVNESYTNGSRLTYVYEGLVGIVLRLDETGLAVERELLRKTCR